MSTKQEKAFSFTENRIKRLQAPTPPDGKTYAQVYFKDSTLPGLQCCVTSAGSKSYYYVRRVDGKPCRMLLGAVDKISVDDARKAAQAKGGQVATGRNPQEERRSKLQEPTLQALYDHWMIYATAHKKPRSVENDKWLWKAYLTPWHGRRLSLIRKADVQALHSKIGTDNGPYAANRMLALLRSMLNKADEVGYRGDNPAKGVKMFKEVSRDRFLQAGELEAFFKALEAEPEIFRDYFLTLLLTGARKTNVMMMRWADLDLAAGCWRIAENKSGSVVVVPLVAPAVEILKARAEHRSGNAYVFPGRKHGTCLQEPDKAWDRIRTAAGLADLRIHDLRRSLGSWMAGQNVSLTIIGKVLGHKSSAATMIYSRLALDPQRNAMEGATTAMLTAGKQTKMLTIDVEAKPADPSPA
jgi:integrase